MDKGIPLGFEMLNGGLITFCLSIIIILTRDLHGKFTLDGVEGVQKFHQNPTPRVGGVALYAGLMVAFLYSESFGRELIKPFIIGVLPAFLFGFMEDITKKVSVRDRLIACVLSGGLISWMTGATIKTVGLPAIDFLFMAGPFSLILTAIAIGGLANAVNIIDGAHGLAVGTVSIGMAGVASVAYLVQDFVLFKIAVTFIVILLAFGITNFPWGKIFLGDGGSYLIGMMLAWLVILLVSRNNLVSPWVPVLICGYPIIETAYSVFRRAWSGSEFSRADDLHLHTLIRTRLSDRVLKNFSPTFRNASVATVPWAFSAAQVLFATMFWDSVLLCAIFFFIIFLLYICTYLVLFSQNLRSRGDLGGR